MRQLKPRTLALTCLASALVAAACASNAPANNLSDTSWTVSSIAGEPVSERAPTLEFASNRLSGAAGCNRYFGGYELDGDRIIVRGVGSTEMACEAPIMRQEAAFLTALSEAQRYRRDGESLVLTSAFGHDITLAPAL